MRARRRRGSSLADDSLELLLDTICNTFGGVLFIAILLAISVQPEPTVATLVSPEDAMNRARAETLIAEMESLQQVLEQQQRLIDDLALASLERMNAGNQEILDTVDNVQAEVDARDAALQDESSAAEQSKETLASLDKSLVDERNREQELRETVEQAYRNREQTISLPDAARTSARIEVGLIMQFGRLYQWHRFDALGLRRGLNTDEMYTRGEGPLGVDVGPIPTRGIDLNAPDAARRVQAKLSRFRTSQHEFAIVVRNDSFAQFSLVRDVIKANGFRYSLFAGNGPVYDRGGESRPTQ